MEDKTRLFIKRERVRRELINTKAGETICLQDWQVEILLDWIKELKNYKKRQEGRIKKYGITRN